MDQVVKPRCAEVPSAHATARARHRSRARRLVVALGAALVVVALSAAPASAAIVTFMSGMGLSAGNVYAANTADAHTTNWVEGDSDHTWCPAVSTGVRGYSSNPPYLAWGACGPYYQFEDYCNCSYNRGTAYNPNQVTFDYIYWANWAY